MKQISSPKKSYSELNKAGENQVKCAEMTTTKLILPELKSPDSALVNRILNYSKSLVVEETSSIGKVANVMS